ncbi:hypothetical protein LTR84_002646 [Exophiala bonariae]|uniref:Chromo domain-containing protein n=1 Tax=Exophiala bonariae TaxID=1690606 RepID=A0AAV9MSW7_9EURO|nr:hypothetical protein LTR84_002646 [Exophiala bonariae]
MSDVDRYSVDDESAGQRDSLFSSPEPEGSAVESDTSVYSNVDKRGEASTLQRLDNCNPSGRGKDQAILFEDDVSDGDAANWVAIQNEMLESQIGNSALRVRPSPTDREVEDDVGPCVESDNREGDDDMYHATTAQYHRQRSRNEMEDSTHKASLPNRYCWTGATRVVGIVQQSSLNDSRRNSPKTASPTFPSSRKRRGAALHESPSRGLDVSIDQIPCRKKVSLSRSTQNHRATQKGRILTGMKSRPDLPLPGARPRSLSCETPPSPSEARQDVEEEVVWEYGRLLDYNIVNGKPLVLVPWIPTWEPPDEYPPEEVDRVRRTSQRQMQRGRPRSKQIM